MVKRSARNKVCARHFWRYCDRGSDGRMTKKEWTTCLGLETNLAFDAFMLLQSKEDRKKPRNEPNLGTTPKPTTTRELFNITNLVLCNTFLHFLDWNLPSDMAAVASSVQDCRSAHQQAIDESHGVNNTFIPECDEFGNYRPIQCYKVYLQLSFYL